MYKKINGSEFSVIKIYDGRILPTDCIENVDCQAYLKWLSEGNTPLPADTITEENK